MSFFDDIDDLEEIISTTQDDADFGNSLLSNIGDCVFYDPISFKYTLASANDSSKISVNDISSWRTIMIGTVINQYEDYSVDVLMGGFLMAEPLYLPIMYYRPSKQKYIRQYAKQMFKRYVSAFFKQLPAYNDLLKLDIEMPTVTDMLRIQQNSDKIFESLKVCSDSLKFDEYIKRLFSSYIYVTHKDKIYQMKIEKDPDAEKKADIIYPDWRASDFLCVFRKIQIFETGGQKPDESTKRFFTEN